MYRVYKDFTFEAAYRLEDLALRGQSFTARLTFASEQTPVCDMDEVERCVADLRRHLDHAYLNEVEGLALPTVEHLSKWIFDRVASRLRTLESVEVARPSCGDGCIYSRD